MKKTYDDKLVEDYVQGNDIDKYDVEELENDSQFMMQVIDKTNDKKMYEFCSSKVKDDYEFIKFMIYKFQNDKDFIVMLADNYLKKHNNQDEEIDANCVELGIIMEGLLSSSKNGKFDKFILLNKAMYNRLLVEFMASYESNSDVKKNNNFGLVFCYFECMFQSRYIILDYYAKQCIEEIFYRNKRHNFEMLIHRIAKDKSELEDKNINSFIINYVSKHDLNLSWYLSCHTDLLTKIKADLKRIYNIWDSFVRCNNSNKVDIFEEYIEKLFDDAKIKPSFTETQLEEFVIRRMNLAQVFKDNLYYYSFRTSQIYFDADYSRDLSDSENIVDIKFCNLALKKAHDLFIDENLDYDDGYINQEEGKIPAKIITFNSQKET